MAFRFTDFLELAAPAAVAFIPGIGIPAAIALSAAMKGGMSAAKGGSATEILRDTALGAASGAGGAALGGAISGTLGKGATKVAEKAAGEAAIKSMAETGMKLGPMGIPQVTGQALKAGSDVLAKGTGLSNLLEKGASLTSAAKGKDPKKTASMLKTIQSGGRVVSAADQAAGMFAPEQPRFSQQHTAMAGQHPGMDPKYQFGQQGFGQPGDGLSMGFGRFY